MNAMRTPCMATRTALLMLTLVCSFAACTAPVPPAGKDNPIVESTSAPAVPVAAAPPIEAEPAMAPTEVVAAAAELPAQGTSPVPASDARPLPVLKPTSATIGKTPVRPVRSPAGSIAGAETASPASITIEALSRGKGVPTQTREAFKQIRSLLEQRQASAAVATMQQQRIGLEGESRLCVEFRNANEAQAAMDEIRKIATDVDLLNVVESPCPSNKESKP